MLLTVLIYGALVGIVLAGILILSSLLGPKAVTPTKEKPFECGSISVDNIENIKVPLSFYEVALAFLVFDIEVIFLFPLAWAIVGGNPGALTAFSIFLAILAVGLVYELKQTKFFKY